jgi:hypothetical protein
MNVCLLNLFGKRHIYRKMKIKSLNHKNLQYKGYSHEKFICIIGIVGQLLKFHTFAFLFFKPIIVFKLNSQIFEVPR